MMGSSRKGHRPYEYASIKNQTSGTCPKCGKYSKILISGIARNEMGKCKSCNAEFKL